MKYWLISYAIQYGKNPAEYFNIVVEDKDRLVDLRGQRFGRFEDNKHRKIILNMMEISEEEYKNLLPCMP